MVTPTGEPADHICACSPNVRPEFEPAEVLPRRDARGCRSDPDRSWNASGFARHSDPIASRWFCRRDGDSPRPDVGAAWAFVVLASPDAGGWDSDSASNNSPFRTDGA